MIAERAARRAEQDEEIRILHRQIETLGHEWQGMPSERERIARKQEVIQPRAANERTEPGEAERTLNAWRIEVAILTERATQAEARCAIVRHLQERQGRST
ncbi:hypothetical protein [Thiocystis violacea]|uniref:hypothetical protein n=1 Tax=Thiocystis violacea TaxID=13725 RepID=UPI001905202F|nr:hypothetical protein [Thiocystis violacea]MBK1720048.1 hypothetical protein [Thiocystis violacea]